MASTRYTFPARQEIGREEIVVVENENVVEERKKVEFLRGPKKTPSVSASDRLDSA